MFPASFASTGTKDMIKMLSPCNWEMFTRDPETNSKFAPENRPGPNRKGLYSNNPVSGAFAVSFRAGTCFLFFSKLTCSIPKTNGCNLKMMMFSKEISVFHGSIFNFVCSWWVFTECLEGFYLFK